MGNLEIRAKRGTGLANPGLTDVSRLELARKLEIMRDDLNVAYDQINDYIDILGFTQYRSKPEFIDAFVSETGHFDKIPEIVDIREILPTTYMHCLRTALEAKMLADDGMKNKEFYIEPDQVSALLTAALIHDYNKNECSHDAVNRDGPITKEELAELKMHVHAGAVIEDYLLKDDGLSPKMMDTIKDIVEGHHPSYGTPLKNGFGKILIAADCYDAGKIREGYQISHPDSKMKGFFQECVDKGMLDMKYANPMIRMINEFSREKEYEGRCNGNQ